MLPASQLQALSDLYALSGIPLLLYHKNGTVIDAFPGRFANLLTSAFLREAGQRSHNKILSVSWDGMYHCTSVPLTDDLFLMTAPCSIMAHHQGALFHAMSSWVIPERQADFLHFISEIPPVGQLQLVKIAQLARHVCALAPLEQNQTWFRTEPGRTNRNRFYKNEPEHPLQQHSALYEPHVIAAIESGNPERLYRSYHRPIDGYIGRMSLDDVRQARYYFVCFMYLASRAAARSGVSREICMRLSDQYCQMMDGIHQIDGIFDLLWKALLDFCHRVESSKGYDGYAPSTRQCISYIEQHLYDPIRIEQIVSFCQLSQRSLTRYFRQDTGTTIPSYINQRRMKEAATLLQETDMSLGQISHLLQYSSQSYLGKLFLQEYGITPLQYRAIHR